MSSLRVAAALAVLLSAAQVRAQEPPILVVVLPSGQVPSEASSAAQQALTTQLGAMAASRPVTAAGAEIQSAIAACTDDACIGAQLAQANAHAAAILRVTARGRRPMPAVLELRDPVSGALRHEPIRGELPTDAASLAVALAPMTEALRASMPNPPAAPASLLVTVNVDGAFVEIDGNEAGSSPLARVELSAGSHEVSVALEGYATQRRQLSVAAGEQARLDVTLSRMTDASETRPGQPMTTQELTAQWWFWALVGGGAAVVLTIIIGIAAGVAASNASNALPAGIMLPPIVEM